MADLNIKKKKRYPVLWALLGILAVAMIVWFFTADNKEGLNENEEELYAESETWGDESDATGTTENADRVNEFITFADETMTIDMNHEATHRGLIQLASALEALTENTGNDLDQMRQEADQLLDNRLSDQHANIMRNAFVTAATIIQNQQGNRENLKQETPEVMEAAKSIDAKEPATDQKTEIKNFFDKAADALAQLQNSEASGSETSY